MTHIYTVDTITRAQSYRAHRRTVVALDAYQAQSLAEEIFPSEVIVSIRKEN